MNSNIELINKDDSGEKYQGENFKIYNKKKNSISGDNSNNPAEEIYLIRGEIELTLGKEKKKYNSPAMIKIPKKTYHKILALNDIKFIIFEE